jgi:hypothetical protein
MADGVTNNPFIRGDSGALRGNGRGSLSRRVDLPRAGAQPMARIILLAALVVSAAGCGGDKPDVAAGPTLSEDAVKQKCADTQWRDKNLGIWYAVCRQPAGW